MKAIASSKVIASGSIVYTVVNTIMIQKPCFRLQHSMNSSLMGQTLMQGESRVKFPSSACAYITCQDFLGGFNGCDVCEVACQYTSMHT